MKTTNILLLSASILAAGLAGCGDDTSGTGGSGGSGTTAATTTSGTTTGGGTTTAATGTGGGGTGGEGVGGAGGGGGEPGFPDVPELGAQLERMGRPAINTATIDTFLYLTNDNPPNIAPSNTVQRNGAEDDYNATSNDDAGRAAFVSTQALQLTVLDALDGVCGNQPLYGFGAEGCLDAEGDPDLVNGEPLVCYGTLATVLNNDQLWVKTTYTSCQIYLGVEADTAGTLGSDVLPQNEDCGGRRPVDDVIETTYSVVAGTVSAGPSFDFDDNITPPADLHPTTFPYFAAPYE